MGDGVPGVPEGAWEALGSPGRRAPAYCADLWLRTVKETARINSSGDINIKYAIDHIIHTYFHKKKGEKIGSAMRDVRRENYNIGGKDLKFKILNSDAVLIRSYNNRSTKIINIVNNKLLV